MRSWPIASRAGVPYVRPALLAFAVALALGCGVRAHGADVYGVFHAPPPPHVEIAENRPGYVWVNGNWAWREGEWHWQSGHYQGERPGGAWQQGVWEKRGKGAWFWSEGRWFER